MVAVGQGGGGPLVMPDGWQWPLYQNLNWGGLEGDLFYVKFARKH